MKPTILKRISLALLFSIFFLTTCDTGIDQGSDIVKEETIAKEEIRLPDGAIAFNYRSGGIYLDLKFNDSIKGSFLFDTGSDQLYLDSQFVSRLNIPLDLQKSKKIFGVGEGTQSVPTVNRFRLSLDSLHHDYTNVPVTNIRAISGGEIDGVFGTELFKPYIVSINFDSSYLKIIYDTLHFSPPAHYDSLKLYYLGKTKTVIECQAELTDSISVSGWTILDLGSGGSLTLTSVIGREHGLDTAISNKYLVSRKLGGYGGKTASWYFRSKSINIGNLVIENPVMNYSTDSSGYLSSWGLLGLMGTKVLERFNIIFDFYNHRFYFTPNEGFQEPFKGNMCGFHAKRVINDSLKRLRIYNVIDGSPAELAGIKKGDLITHIDGVRISQVSESERKKLLSQEDIPVVLHLDRNGIKHQVILSPIKII